MMNWAKQQLANVAGTQEPIYGPSAIQTVAKQAEKTPYTELVRADHAWEIMDSTSVETQCFYLTADNGHFAMIQLLYSNVAGLRITAQFSTEIFYPDREKPHLFCTNPLSNIEFSDDKTAFYADDCAVELSKDGKTYTIKSATNNENLVNLSITRVAPPFVAGKDGKSLFGTDLQNPWGSLRHAFWPQCTAEGTMTTTDGPIDFKGKAMFIHALQGMKPHHAAAKWDFCNFQSPNYAAILMQYVTPPSYGSTVCSVGGIVKNGEIITAGTTNSAAHLESIQDLETGWPEPSVIKFSWTGKTKDGKEVNAVIETSLGKRLDRVDIMAEVPGFVKTIIAGAVGTKPYVYQYWPTTPVFLKIKIGDKEITEEGSLFTEASFVCE